MLEAHQGSLQMQSNQRLKRGNQRSAKSNVSYVTAKEPNPTRSQVTVTSGVTVICGRNLHTSGTIDPGFKVELVPHWY